MKQKKINDILYVFDITPYQITEDTDAEVIKVQEECVAGFKELNESLADKIVAYNYHTMTVTQQEWAPYVDQDEPEPPVVKNYTFTLYPGAERGKVIVNFSDGLSRQATVDDTHMPGMNDPINIEGYGEYEGYVYTYEVPENIEITLNPLYGINNYTYDTNAYSYDSETLLLTPSIVMDADKAVYCVYAEQAEPDTYTITIDADGLNDQNTEFKINGESVTLSGSYTVNSGSYFEFYPLTSYSDFDVTGLTLDDTAGSEHWYSGPIYADAQYAIHYKG
jgi:hypothetical protein